MLRLQNELSSKKNTLTNSEQELQQAKLYEATLVQQKQKDIQLKNNLISQKNAVINKQSANTKNSLSSIVWNVFYKYNRCLLIIFLCIQVNIIYAEPLRVEALKIFEECLCKNRDNLEVRDLKDFYRIRGIPAKCCQDLATNFLPSDLTKSVQRIDSSNCRINIFLSQDTVFDPHTHPLHFVSYVVSGGYTHTIFHKAIKIIDNKTHTTNSECIADNNEVCTEHTKIYTTTDTLHLLGAVKLTESHKESFATGDFIVFNDTNIIHRIDTLAPETLTINFLSDIGDKEIDVFISHQTPERVVLLKADTRQFVKKAIASDVIDKCIKILKAKSSTCTKVVGSAR